MGVSTAERGKFIVIEGLDGAGISEQATRLERHLRARGFRTLLTKEPTSNQIGSFIKSALKQDWHSTSKSLQLLFSADRAKHLEDEIEPAIEEGRYVICDRYFFSTLAYGFASGMNFEWLYAVNRAFRVPDLTIFVDISPDMSVSRIAKGKERREIFEKREALNKVRRAYLNLAKRFRFRIVNGENGARETGDEIAELVDGYFKLKPKNK